MKVMMFLEHKFYVDKKNKIFCEKVINDEILERYTSVFGNVTICVRLLDEKPQSAILITNPNITIFPLPNINFKKIFNCYPKLIKSIKTEANKFDGFIIRSPSMISFIAYNAVKKIHKPIMTELVINPKHFFMDEENVFILKKCIFNLLRRIVVNHTKKMCKSVNAVLYVTNESLQNDYKSRSLLKGETNEYFSVACSDVILKPENYNSIPTVHNFSEPFVICHIGWMMGLNKGHKTVIEIINKLKKEFKNCKAIFIGDGPMKTQFEQYAISLGLKDEVQFLGKINSSAEIQKILITSHLFLFPSVNEGLPRVLLEAMSNSLPCVAYNTDGIPELLENKYMADIGDEDGLLRIIENLYSNEKERIEYGKRCYEKSLEYSSEKLNQIRSLFYQKFYELIDTWNKKGI